MLMFTMVGLGWAGRVWLDTQISGQGDVSTGLVTLEPGSHAACGEWSYFCDVNKFHLYIYSLRDGYKNAWVQGFQALHLTHSLRTKHEPLMMSKA